MVPASAYAGAGDYFKNGLLKPHYGYTSRTVRKTFKETESWNSNAEGVGSCTGVGNGVADWEGIVCVGDIRHGYDEVYCIVKCQGYAYTRAQLENDSSKYASYFTGWEDYN